jgi:hypothetical protein
MAVTLCPIALAVGCRKCPIFKVCPVKGIIGDQRSAPEAPATVKPSTSRKRAEGAAPPRAKRKGGRPRRRDR